ncbi:hypothetical protein HAX54_051009 [Datura stramonium]|uniref:Uncharacterized protein n=1 Tax=Datura stramonium TaxID=4076 RepID=A0ABS8RR51_DATST|nr:hypothetical protein [Datura stramonium]
MEAKKVAIRTSLELSRQACGGELYDNAAWRLVIYFKLERYWEITVQGRSSKSIIWRHYERRVLDLQNKLITATLEIEVPKMMQVMTGSFIFLLVFEQFL